MADELNTEAINTRMDLMRASDERAELEIRQIEVQIERLRTRKDMLERTRQQYSGAIQMGQMLLDDAKKQAEKKAKAEEFLPEIAQ